MKVFEPPLPIEVRETEKVPALRYTCEKFVCEVFVVVPSPKFQKPLVIEPVELSEKVTLNGRTPTSGVAVNEATGGGGTTAIGALTELFPTAGSGVRDETVAVLVNEP